MYYTDLLLVPFSYNLYNNNVGLDRIDLNLINIIDLIYLFSIILIIIALICIVLSRKKHDYRLIPNIDLDEEEDVDVELDKNTNKNNNIINGYVNFTRDEYF